MKSNKIILLDGGVGQEIYKRAGSPESQTLWSLQIMRDNPEIVVDVHMDFINAGSKVLSLNNYKNLYVGLALVCLLKQLYSYSFCQVLKLL